MEYQDEKLNKFMQAVNKDAEERRARILAEAEEVYKREMGRAEEDALNEAYHLIRQETAEMRNKIAWELSVKEASLRREVVMKRERIAGSILEDVRQKLINFTQTPEYPEFMMNLVKRAAMLFGSNRVVLQLKPGDMELGGVLSEVFGGKCVLQGNPGITIGGIRVICQDIGRSVDETLDSRLNSQRKWFVENPELAIN